MISLCILSLFLLSAKVSPASVIKVSDTETSKAKAECRLELSSTNVFVIPDAAGDYDCQCLHDRIVSNQENYDDCKGNVARSQNIIVPQMSCNYTNGTILYNSEIDFVDCQCLLNAVTSAFPSFDPVGFCRNKRYSFPKCDDTKGKLRKRCANLSTASIPYSEICKLENEYCYYYPNDWTLIKSIAKSYYNMPAECIDPCCSGVNVPSKC